MRDILFEWNPWWSKEYSYEGIKREILQQIMPWLDRKEILAITGTRRSGKTTLLYEIIEYRIKKGQNPKDILFIKADDDRIEKKDLIDTAISEYLKFINPSEDILIIIDEIQEISSWEKTLKRLYDLKEKYKILISGSNSSIIKDSLSSLLAGRFAYFEVFPFSFREFLSAKEVEVKSKIDLMKKRNTLRHLLTEFVKEGAFPEITLEKRGDIKKELLGFYFESIFYRDIIKRCNIRNPAKMELLVKYYLTNVSNTANFTKIAKLIELSTDSVVEYTKYLENAYLIFPINLFDYSYKKQIINPKKIYCVDSGIRNIVGFKFSEDIGRLYENAVFIHLRRTRKEIFYSKNKNECDFILKEGKKFEAVQVCYDIKKSKEREVAGLVEAMKKHNLRKGTIITEDYSAKEEIEGRHIKFIPLWQYLLK